MTAQESEELKPCPFCGSEATIIPVYHQYAEDTGYGIVCINRTICGVLPKSDMYFSSEQEAIKAWNIRK